MKQYHTAQYVTSEDLNIHGTLYAAKGAMWMVEAAFSAGALAYGNTRDVILAGVKEMKYHKPVNLGDILSFYGRVVQVGTTSFTVYVEAVTEFNNEKALEAYAVFVAYDGAEGKKIPHNITLDEAEDEKEEAIRAKAKSLYK